MKNHYKSKGTSINTFFGRITSLRGTRNLAVYCILSRFLRSVRLVLHPKLCIYRTALKLLLSLLLACSFPVLADNHEGHEHHHHQQETVLSTPGTDSIFNINDSWTAADGKTFQLSSLGGKPTVIAMIYTSCQYVCPLTVQNMKRIERSIPADQADKVNFAVFSFDPERDTPPKLTAFAKTHSINSPSWVLAQGNAGSVRKLAVALGIKYKKVKSGDYEHDATISVLDSNGVIKFQADAMNKNIDGASNALKELLH